MQMSYERNAAKVKVSVALGKEEILKRSNKFHGILFIILNMINSVWVAKKGLVNVWERD